MAMRAGRGLNPVTLETPLQLYGKRFCTVLRISARESGKRLLIQKRFKFAFVILFVTKRN
jgi:hypothetical protein